MKTPLAPTRKTFFWAWLILVILHFTILGSAYVRLQWFNTPLIIVLALVQMVLIILYFMEVRYGKRLIWAVAAVGFFWLFLQWTLTMSDYLTRQWH
jgi:caa(3)-type oxidase subunit IV